MTRFWTKLFRSGPWVALALALLTFAVAFVAAAVPRILGDAGDRQLAETVDALPATQRDPAAVWKQSGTPGGMVDEQNMGQVVFDRWRGDAQTMLDGLESPLSTLLSPARFVASDQAPTAQYAPPLESGLYNVTVSGTLNPDLTEDMTLVEGEWPTAGDEAPFPAVLGKQAADKIRAEVGEVLAGQYEVVGIVEPTDPDDDRWKHFDHGFRPYITVNPDRGEAATVGAYLAPDAVGNPSGGRFSTWGVTMWYPASSERVPSAATPVRLAEQLTSFLSAVHPLQTTSGGITLRSELGDALDQSARRHVAATTLVGVVAAGPLGLAGALLALGSALVVTRRRAHLELLVARGASRRQLVTAIAAEGLALGLPAAVAGHLLAMLVPGPGAWWQWVVTVLIGLAPAASLALALGDPTDRSRKDLTARGGRKRLVVELGVLVVTAAALWQLLRSSASTTAVDFLAVATPLLLAACAGLLAMRVLPLPLAPILAWFRGRRGIVGHLGAARALRDPAGGLLPTLAVVLGATVTVTATTLLGTVTTAAEDAAWEDVGADVKINGTVRPDMLESIRGVEGVAQTASIGSTSQQLGYASGDDARQLTVWVVDDEARQVWEGTALASRIPEGLFDGGLVTGGEVETSEPTASLSRIGELPVAGHLDAIPGVVTRSEWVLITRSTWERSERPHPGAGVTYLSLEPGADPEATATNAVGLVPYGQASTVATALERNTGSAVSRVLSQAFVAAAGVATALTALALVVVQLMGARSRADLLAVLRTQGIRRRQSMGIVAWEVGPLAVLAVVIGTLAGLGISWLLVTALDLTGLTGGDASPGLHLDPLALLTVVGVVAGTIAASVTLTAWLAGRTNLAQTLRIGEER